jgi:aspartate kinase
MITVEKIGGTSMIKFEDVLNNIILREYPYNRAFVVSAYSGVTNLLLSDKKTKADGIYSLFKQKGGDYLSKLNELILKLEKINKNFEYLGLNLTEASEFLVRRIEKTKKHLKSISDVIATGYVNKENILLASKEILASLGEAHSAFNTVNILKNRGINAVFIDLSGIEDSDYISIDERIDKNLKHIDLTTQLPIITGYTKGYEGLMREFDRGYSEITFSKIAVKLNADEAIIHKEFHLSSADPSIVGIKNSKPILFTNYDVADQLADVGMEAIHPKASKPLEIANINLRVKSTFEPKHPGTLITRDFINKNAVIEIIAGSKDVVAIEVCEPIMVGEVGFDLKIMQILKEYNISYISKSTAANSITTIIWKRDFSEKLKNDLENKFYKVLTEDVAIITVIGSNIANYGILAKVTNILAENKINIKAISLAMKQVNIQLIIDKYEYEKAIYKLNSLC